MGKNNKVVVLFIFLLVFGMTGCNIFKWLHKPKGDAGEHIAQGQKHLDDRDYAAAISEFEDAMECDPRNADARYGYAKAYARLYLKKDIFDLASDFSEPEAEEFLLDFSDEEIDSIYDVSSKVMDVLKDVYNGRCHGRVKSQTIYLDYGMSCTLKAVTYAMVRFRGLMWKFDDFTDGFVLDNLEQLLEQLSPEEAKETINEVIKVVEELLPLASDAIQAAMKDESQEIKDAVNEILENIGKYRCDDGEDNDGDGRIDEELLNGEDDDGDGLIDEDSRV